MALGFVLVVSFLAGEAASRLRMPAITGYILTGVLFGPYVLRLVSPQLTVLREDSVSTLQLLDGMALGLIALTAGGELKLSLLRQRWRGIAWVTALQTLIVLFVVGGAVFLLRGSFPRLEALPPALGVAACALIGITAVANSPATTIAVIQESRAKGPMTELILGITVLKDVVVISLFTVILATSLTLFEPGRGLDPQFLGVLAWEVFGSIALGLALGYLVRLYMRHIGRDLPIIILGLAFISVAVSGKVHVSGLLLCMTAGFYIENFTNRGEELIEALERHSLPVYVIFFTIAGAGIDLPSLARTWPLALLIVGARLAGKVSGTALGARISDSGSASVRFGWSGFVAQAGVTLGLAVLINRSLSRSFPELGAYLSSLILGVVAVNQIIGPVVFKWGLQRSGESRAKPEASIPGQTLDVGDAEKT
jgi:Kef-type K+ transport system membrane component KefB